MLIVHKFHRLAKSRYLPGCLEVAVGVVGAAVVEVVGEVGQDTAQLDSAASKHLASDL